MSADSFEHGPDGLKRNTHLLSWLDDGYTHCQHGSKEWCELYLSNAAEVIRAQDDRIASLEAERDNARRQRDEIGRAWDKADARAKEAEALAASLETALAQAREALEPFAELGADEGHEDHPDDTPAVIKIGRVTDFSMHLSDFRRAAALSSSKQKDGGE